jgi:hypothetical protein
MKNSSIRAICVRALLTVAGFACLHLASAQTGYGQTGPAGANARMTVEDVVRLSKAGISDDIILAQIRSRLQAFDLTTDQLIQLKSAAVSDRVIRAMMETPGQQAPSAAQRPPVPQSAPIPAPANRPVTRPAMVQWIRHDDPMGFSVNSPEGWALSTNRQPGRVDIQGPAGQQAVIWPVFVERQQLDERGVGSLAQQLIRRVDAGMSWGAPQVMGDSIRIIASGQSYGTALVRWSASARGTGILLLCVSAPASVYPGSVDIFTGILQSFHVVADPQAETAAVTRASAPAPVTWVNWRDPREGAFTASVPQGWSVSGGAFRQSATDIRMSVVLLSPDRQIRMTVGDTNVGIYTAPNGLTALGGVRNGGAMAVGDGSRIQIRRYVEAQQFVSEYVASTVSRACGNVRVLASNDRPDLAAQAMGKARGQGAPGPRVTAAGWSFSCNWNGREARGYYAAATVLPFPGRNGIWYVESLYGYIAVPEQFQQADEISRHTLNSLGINAQWQQDENRVAGNAVQQDNARSQEIQARARAAILKNQNDVNEGIIKGGEERNRIMDEVARKRENAILGTVDVVDTNGKQYKVDNYSDYHWMSNEGYIRGTSTDTSPGANYHELLRRP